MPGARRSDRRRGGTGLATSTGTGASDARLAARAERTAVFGKTKMCKFHILGMCAKGTDCCFAHDQAEMNPIPDLSRTKICKTLINTGICTDDNCKYAHNRDELRDVPPGSITDDFSGKQRSAKTTANAPSLSLPQGMRPGGQDEAVAAQNMAQMQQWMAMMHYAMMSRQPESTSMGYAEMQPQQTPTAPVSQSLYNALFDDTQHTSPQVHCPDAKASPPVPSVEKSKSSTDKAKSLQQASPTACACGNILSWEAKFCPKCGAKTQRYDVKNTFVEIPDPLAKKHGIRSVQSATAALNSYLDESPLSTNSGDDAMGATLGVPSQRLPRMATWASDLDTLDEESPKEDEISGLSADVQSEKRLQDTPLNSGLHRCEEAVPEGTVESSPEGMLAMENMRVKNTFLEFRTDAPRTGMRMVRTAAGRLDLMGASSEQ
mmetsp:Transcript_6773/g.10864  ORF Transcript_6773/g.10864 Transcript_6773/m.10864 type:complete len:433 (+) Transcript_6773:60-1358(+)